MSYTIFDPQVDGPCHLLSRKEARKSFNWFLSQKDARQHIFWEEMRRKGYTKPDSHDELCVMFERVLIDAVAESGHQLAGYHYSLCLDMGICLGEALIRLSPDVRWVLCTFGKTNVYYHRPVLIGFDVPNKTFSYDFDYGLCAYINRLATEGEEVGWVAKMFNAAKGYLPK